MPEQLVGTVTHYFKGPSVAIVRLAEGELAVGDRVRFHGHTTEFTTQIGSMQLNHQPVERAQVGDEVAIKVTDRTRPHDQVFKVSEGDVTV
jgi:translation elongation factor EF-1alpha